MELVVDVARPVVAVGECMLELSHLTASGERRLGAGWCLGLGGDTYNTAVYLSRSGLPVRYLSVLGVDPYSAEMLAIWRAEGLDTGLVLRHPGRLPGLYAIHTDGNGERSFTYWRSHSAARALFDLPEAGRALRAAEAAGLLYLSGITLSLFDAERRRRLVDLAGRVRARGGAVAFDPNYRVAGWDDAAAARAAIGEIAPLVSIALPTADDEERLFGAASADQVIDRWQRYGAGEVVVKRGAAGCRFGSGSQRFDVPAAEVPQVIDTTGAGDAFNAGYLAARVGGAGARAAARAAAHQAAQVIQHHGAIVPRTR